MCTLVLGLLLCVLWIWAALVCSLVLGCSYVWFGFGLLLCVVVWFLAAILCSLVLGCFCV